MAPSADAPSRPTTAVSTRPISAIPACAKEIGAASRSNFFSSSKASLDSGRHLGRERVVGDVAERHREHESDEDPRHRHDGGHRDEPARDREREKDGAGGADEERAVPVDQPARELRGKEAYEAPVQIE